MDYDEIYQPLIDFISANSDTLLFLQGEVDDESNEVMFYLPESVQGDKDAHRLYVEFEVPNSMIDKVIENQQKLQEICASFE